MKSKVASTEFEEAVSELEDALDTIRIQMPQYKVEEPFLRGDEAILDDLMSFLKDYPEIKAEKTNIINFSADTNTILGVWFAVGAGLTGVAQVISAFLKTRKYSIKFPVGRRMVTIQGPTADEVERLLKAVHQVMIEPEPAKKKEKGKSKRSRTRGT